MLITIENEAKRLGERYRNIADLAQRPFVVTAFRSTKSRNPLMVRFASASEAFVFVEHLAGSPVIRYVQQKGFDYQVETFTGVHAERFDWCQYQTPKPSIDAILSEQEARR